MVSNAMADASAPEKSPGCLSRLVFLFLAAIILGLGICVYHVAQPQDLSDIRGYGKPLNTLPVRELQPVLQQSSLRNYPIRLTEEQLNVWLFRTLELKQGGVFSDKASLDHVWVRLEEGRAEVILERHIYGHPLTVSTYIQIAKNVTPDEIQTEVTFHGGPFHPDYPAITQGGRFGQLVVPQGFLTLVMPSFRKLADAYSKEIQIGLGMSRIRIEKDQIILDPRSTAGEAGMPESF